MSQTAEYLEHAPEPLYDRLTGRSFSPENIPGADTEIHLGKIHRKASEMSVEKRKEISGKPTIFATEEKLLHEETHGVGFCGPVTVSFNLEPHGNGPSELRLSVSNSPHGDDNEDAHRAFRTDPITAGEYRQKYRVMLQEYDDNRKAKRKVQETKNRIQNRIDAVKKEIRNRARSHPKISEKGETWAERFGKVKRIELPDEAQLIALEPSNRGRGVDLKAQRLDPEFAFLLLSILREGHGELVKLIGRLDRTLRYSGHSDLLARLQDFFDTGDEQDVNH
jgi:hypothetical protein